MIKEIIPAITPTNINDIQVIKDSMDIFLEYLTEHSDISIDIKNILDQKKTPIYEEFVKIYLSGINDVLSKSEHNEALYNKLKTSYKAAGLDIEDIDLSIDITKLLTEDYILTNKSYKEGKGTSKSMEYIFNIIINSGVQNDFLGDNIGRFRYFEGKDLFEYHIEGTMIDEVYNHFVKPLTHPVGWAYFYQRVFYQAFTDYFKLEFEYTFADNGLEVRCMNGDIFNKDDYLNNISHVGQQLVQDNRVVFISVDILGTEGNSTERTSVYFASGETLISENNPRSLLLIDENNILIDYDNYDGNCGLFLDYTVEVTSTVEDDIDFQNISQLSSTTGKHNVIGAGNVYIGSFIIGDELVNKNVSSTYKSYTGKHDGAAYTRTFAAGGITDLETAGDYWDKLHLRFDEFELDGYVFGGEPVVPNLSGKTARDEYEWTQELSYCRTDRTKPKLADGRDNHICEVVFEDSMLHDVSWDLFRLKFDDFSYDGEYAEEDFSINYDKNVWDTDVYFDNYYFDSNYIGGGFFVGTP